MKKLNEKTLAEIKAVIAKHTTARERKAELTRAGYYISREKVVNCSMINMELPIIYSFKNINLVQISKPVMFNNSYWAWCAVFTHLVKITEVEHKEEKANKKQLAAGNIFNKDKVKLFIANDDSVDYLTMDGVSEEEREFYKIGSITMKALKSHLEELLKETRFSVITKGSGFFEIVMKGKRSFDFNCYKEFIELFKKHKSVGKPTQLTDLLLEWEKTYYIDSYSSVYDINSYATDKGFYTIFFDMEKGRFGAKK